MSLCPLTPGVPGYCLYSSSTVMMFSMGDGVHGFTMDPSIGEFVLTHRNVRAHTRTHRYYPPHLLALPKPLPSPLPCLLFGLHVDSLKAPCPVVHLSAYIQSRCASPRGVAFTASTRPTNSNGREVRPSPISPHRMRDGRRDLTPVFTSRVRPSPALLPPHRVLSRPARVREEDQAGQGRAGLVLHVPLHRLTGAATDTAAAAVIAALSPMIHASASTSFPLPLPPPAFSLC